MNILILGHGVEGKSAEQYFKNDPSLSEHTKVDVLDNFKKEELLFKDFSNYDLIFRTPSIPPKFIPVPKEKITSVTKFFFSNCPCPIIGVTGTKGKGTTCTMIRDLLSACGEHAYLVGNIGTPALDILPELTKNDVVVYELSSFQLWALEKSPAISVILRIEPDHLDVHESFEEYLSAKQNILNFQSEDDFCVYFKDNENTKKLVEKARAKTLPYPLENAEKSEKMSEVLSALKTPGAHNRENAEAALLASFAYFKKSKGFSGEFSDFLTEYVSQLSTALKNFKPLPHHIEFIRELNGVKYYDDSFSTVFPSLEAAVKSFPDSPLILIAGGKDKGFDLEPAKRLIFDNPHLVKAVLIGEIADKLADNEDPEKFFKAGKDFELAVSKAREFAEKKLNDEEMNSDTCLVDKKPEIKSPVVLLSPCASSFDMFESYKQRGDVFKQLINEF